MKKLSVWVRLGGERTRSCSEAPVSIYSTFICIHSGDMIVDFGKEERRNILGHKAKVGSVLRRVC